MRRYVRFWGAGSGATTIKTTRMPHNGPRSFHDRWSLLLLLSASPVDLFAVIAPGQNLHETEVARCPQFGRYLGKSGHGADIVKTTRLTRNGNGLRRTVADNLALWHPSGAHTLVDALTAG